MWIKDRPKWIQDAARRIIQNGALGDKGFVDLLDICKQQVLGQKIAFVGLPDGALCASSPPAVCAGGFRDQSRDAWHSIERELLRLARTRTAPVANLKPISRQGAQPATFTSNALSPYFMGRSQLAKTVTVNATNPMMRSIGVQVFRVSTSVRPDICLTTQKPLSFIHETPLEPAPMAMAM